MSSTHSHSPHNTSNQSRPHRRLVQLQSSSTTPSRSSLPRATTSTIAGIQGAETVMNHATNSFLPSTATWASRTSPTTVANEASSVMVDTPASIAPPVAITSGMIMERKDSGISLHQDWDQAEERNDLSFLAASEIMFADGSIVTVAQAQAQLYGIDKGTSTLETPLCKSPVPVITKVAATTTAPTFTSFGTKFRAEECDDLSFLEAPEIMFADGSIVTVAQAQAQLHGIDKGTSTLETPLCKSPVHVIAKIAATATAPTFTSFGTKSPIAGEYLWDELDCLVEAKGAGGSTNPPAGDEVSIAVTEYGVPSAPPTRESAGAGATGAADPNGITANANDIKSSNSGNNVILKNVDDSGEKPSATNTPVTTNTNAKTGAGASITGQKADNTLIPQQHAIQVFIATQQQLQSLRRHLNESMQNQQQRLQVFDRIIQRSSKGINVCGIHKERKEVANNFRQESKVLQKQIDVLQNVLQQDMTNLSATGVTQEMIKEQRTRGPSMLTQQAIEVAEQAAEQALTRAVEQLGRLQAAEKMATQVRVDAYQEFGQQQAGMHIVNNLDAAAGSIGVKDAKRAGTAAAVDPSLGSAARPSDHNPATKVNLPGDIKMDKGHSHDTLLSNSSGLRREGMAGSGGIDQDMPAAQGVEKQTTVDGVADRIINGQLNAGLSGVPDDVGTGQAKDASRINRDTVMANVAAGTGVAPTRSTISAIAVKKQADVQDISGVSMANSPISVQQKPELPTVDVTIVLPHQEDRPQQQPTASKTQQPQQRLLQQYQQEQDTMQMQHLALQKPQQQQQHQHLQLPMEQIKEAFHEPLALVHLKTQDWSPGLSLAYSTSRLAQPDPWRQLALQPLISTTTASPCPDPSNAAAQSQAKHSLRNVFGLLSSSLRSFIAPSA